MNWSEVKLNNLAEIQSELIKVIPENKLGIFSLFYLPNNLLLFSSIKVLRDALVHLQLQNYVRGFAFLILPPSTKLPIHQDIGKFKWSLNIPLQVIPGCFLKLYTNFNGIVETVKLPDGNIFHKHESENCNLIEVHDTITPYFFNTSIPHTVENCSEVDQIQLLIRFDSIDPAAEHIINEHNQKR
jgi:hypothetical protein